jgi:hypothetical protein
MSMPGGLEDVLEHRGTELADACRERLAYYEYPALKLDWTPEEWTRSIAGADLVVFDSSRMALSSVGLSEDVNDDYARFVNALVVPLTRANTTTWILDNVGHGEGGHPRGASAKVDLNEVVFELVAVESFDRDTTGKLVWRRKRQRFSGVPLAMEQTIGGGSFEMPAPITQEQGAEPGKFRPTFLMEQVSRVVEAEPGMLDQLRRRTREGQARVRLQGDPAATRRGLHPPRGWAQSQPHALLEHALPGG